MKNKFHMPELALQNHIAIIGKAGSGKTVTAKGMVEGILDRKERAVIIDPTGVWWGLKSSADGKKAGYPVLIFGGEHGDVPINEKQGEAVAELVGTSETPIIIDTLLMRVGERTRFFADFGNALLRKNKGPLHIVIDEAHLFAPQGKVADPQSANMLHAANNLVSLGRARGLRVTLISQRPAKLHKDSLTQVETMVAMRLTSPQDRDALKAWIADQANDAEGKRIIASLPSLKTGVGWVWAPQLEMLEQVHFPMIKTLDTSKTPDGKTTDGRTPTLAKIDIKGASAHLAAFVQEAKDNDVAALKRRIKELEAKPSGASKAELDAAQKEAWADGQKVGYEDGHKQGWDDAFNAVWDALRLANSPPIKPTRVETKQATKEIGFKKRSIEIIGTKVEAIPAGVLGSNFISGEKITLPTGELAILKVCAQYPEGVKRDQISILTGYKKSSRDAYLQRLQNKGLVTTENGGLVATNAGMAALGDDFEPLPTGKDLQSWWLERLPEGEKKILAFLINCYPSAASRDEISDATDFKKSTRDAYIQRLQRRMLITIQDRLIQAAHHLF